MKCIPRFPPSSSDDPNPMMDPDLGQNPMPRAGLGGSPGSVQHVMNFIQDQQVGSRNHRIFLYLPQIMSIMRL